MKLLILIQHPFALWCAPAWLAERIHSEFPQIEAERLSSYKNVDEHIRDAEIFFGWSLRGEQVRVAKKLRWIHSTAAAVHQLMSPELRASDIVVSNARSVHGPVVAEHAVALMFALAKRLPAATRYQQQHLWAQEPISCQNPHPTELAGSTLGLVGYGAIGSEVARSATALGMRVLVVRLHPQRESTAAQIFGPDGVDEVVAQSDFLVLAAPVTEQTQHVINAERLARMKPEAYVINVARGSLIDESALVAALSAGRIAGAALDVAGEEPLPASSPLWSLENCFVTPHLSGASDSLWVRQADLLLDNLGRWFSGRELRNRVDLSRGY